MDALPLFENRSPVTLIVGSLCNEVLWPDGLIFIAFFRNVKNVPFFLKLVYRGNLKSLFFNLLIYLSINVLRYIYPKIRDDF